MERLKKLTKKELIEIIMELEKIAKDNKLIAERSVKLVSDQEILHSTEPITETVH